MDNFENVSYGNGQNNYFGAETMDELLAKLDSCSKSEIRGLAGKIGLNPNHKFTTVKDMILKEFRSYKAKNSPIPAPTPMFADASEDIQDMIKSVGKVSQDEKAKKKWSKKKSGKKDS